MCVTIHPCSILSNEKTAEERHGKVVCKAHMCLTVCCEYFRSVISSSEQRMAIEHQALKHSHSA